MKPTLESEKMLERRLKNFVKSKLKGWTLKLAALHISGLPDQLCLIPGGILFFAEVKTTGKKPSAIQRVIHRKLRKLGFSVYVVDSSKIIDEIIEKYKTND